MDNRRSKACVRPELFDKLYQFTGRLKFKMNKDMSAMVPRLEDIDQFCEDIHFTIEYTL